MTKKKNKKKSWWDWLAKMRRKIIAINATPPKERPKVSLKELGKIDF